MDAGVDGLCLLASYSGQFSLTGAERDAIARGESPRPDDPYLKGTVTGPGRGR